MLQRLGLFLPLVVFAFLTYLFFQVERGVEQGAYDPNASPSARMHQPVPDFDLPLVDAPGRFSRADLPRQIHVLTVWATWCPSCVYEHRELMKLAPVLDVPIYGIDYKDDNAKALAWLEKLGNPYVANIDDAKGRLALDLGVTGAPEQFLVDAQGIIRHHHLGPLDAAVWEREFAPVVARLRGEATQ